MKTDSEIEPLDWEIISEEDYIRSHKSCEDQYNID